MKLLRSRTEKQFDVLPKVARVIYVWSHVRSQFFFGDIFVGRLFRVIAVRPPLCVSLCRTRHLLTNHFFSFNPSVVRTMFPACTTMSSSSAKERRPPDAQRPDCMKPMSPSTAENIHLNSNYDNCCVVRITNIHVVNSVRYLLWNSKLDTPTFADKRFILYVNTYEYISTR